MNLKPLKLLLITFLLLSMKVSASPSFTEKYNASSHTQKKERRNATLNTNKPPYSVDVFPNRYTPKANKNSKSLALKADFWFAFFAIGSLASMWLIKPNKG